MTDPEALLRRWFTERQPEEREQIAAFLEAATPSAGPRAERTRGAPSNLPSGPAPLVDTPASRVVRIVLDDLAQLRDQMWHTAETHAGVEGHLAELAASIERTCDQMLALSLGHYLEAYEERVREQAGMDPLTGLVGRALLNRRLTEELARATRYQRGFALLFIDLDRLKQINDTRGHLVGDHVLQQIAGVLRDAARHADTVGRYGGDEFVGILPETGRAGAIAVTQRVLHRVAEIDSPLEEPLGVSIGIALFPDSGVTLDELLEAADGALYQAKGRGGNSYAVADPIRRSRGQADNPDPSSPSNPEISPGPAS